MDKGVVNGVIGRCTHLSGITEIVNWIEIAKIKFTSSFHTNEHVGAKRNNASEYIVASPDLVFI